MIAQQQAHDANRIAKFVGALFLIAMAASLIGGGLVEAILSASDYLVTMTENTPQLILGILLELINAIAVLGIGVLMYPILRIHSQNLALGYLGFRIVEAVFCSAIVISPLALLSLSQEFGQAGSTNIAAIEAAGALAMAGRASIASLLIPVFLGLGALLLYSLLYRSKLLPRWLAVWGLLGAILILLLNLGITFGLEISMGLALLFALPIISNEIVLGIWLIVKGFNPSALSPAS